MSKKFSKFFQTEKILLLNLVEKVSRKNRVVDNGDNLVITIGIKLLKDENNKDTYIIPYCVSIKNPKEKHVPRRANYVIYNKFINQTPDGIVQFSANESMNDSTLLKFYILVILSDIGEKISKQKFKMLKGSVKTNKLLNRVEKLIFTSATDIIHELDTQNPEKK